MNPDSPRAPSAALERVCAAAIALGLVLRAAGLGAELGPQELMGLRPSSRPLLTMLRLLYSSVEAGDPPLFHVLLRGWGTAFGFSLLSVRGFTLLLGMGAVAAAAWAARKLFGARAAWIAAAVAAVHPFAVAYSLVARPYCLLVLLGFLGAGLLVEAERKDTLRAWSLFFAAALGAALTHNHGPFLVAAALAWLACRAAAGAWRPSARSLVPAAIAALAYCAWLPGLLFQLRSGFIPVDDPSPLNAAYALTGVGVHVEHSATLWPAPLLALAACAALASWLAARAAPRTRGALLALAAVGALSLAGPIAWSYAAMPVFSPWHHAILAFPAVALFWAGGLAELSDGALAAAGLALAALFSYPLAGFLTRERTPFPAIAAAVSEWSAPGTLVLFQPPYRREFVSPYAPAVAARPAPLCGRAAEDLPPAVVLVQVRVRTSVLDSERCDRRVLRERYVRVATREFGWYAAVERYERKRI